MDYELTSIRQTDKIVSANSHDAITDILNKYTKRGGYEEDWRCCKTPYYSSQERP